VRRRRRRRRRKWIVGGSEWIVWRESSNVNIACSVHYGR